MKEFAEREKKNRELPHEAESSLSEQFILKGNIEEEEEEDEEQTFRALATSSLWRDVNNF